MIKKIDSKILAACTKFSHALQRTTGLTCYFVAKIGIACVGSSLVVDLINRFYRILTYTTPWFIVILDGIMVVALGIQSIVLSQAEQSIQNGETIKSRWIWRYVHNSRWRVLWLAFAAFDLSLSVVLFTEGATMIQAYHSFGFSFGTAVFYYFVAVDPLPRGKSRVRAWLEKLTSIRKAVPVHVDS